MTFDNDNGISLIPGTVARIYNDEVVVNPRLQVIFCKPLDKDQHDQPRWKAALSDSTNFIQAIVLSPLNPYFESKQIEQGTMVTVTKYSMTDLKGHHIMLVGEVDSSSIVKMNAKFGTPTNIESVGRDVVEPQVKQPVEPVSAPAAINRPYDTSSNARTTPMMGGMVTADNSFATNNSSASNNSYAANNTFAANNSYTANSTYAANNSFAPNNSYAANNPFAASNNSTNNTGGIPSNWQGDYSAAKMTSKQQQPQHDQSSDFDNAIIMPIGGLSPYQNTWTIKARVTSKSEIRKWANDKRNGTLFSVNFLDESGEIKASGFNDVVDKFYDMLQVGQVYYVSGGQVKIANPKFNTLAHAYEITLEANSHIAPCHNAANSVPTVKFSFIPINLIADSDKDAFVDVIGVVHEVGELGNVTAKATGKVLSKRDLVLVDKSKHSVRVTLWGKEAEDFVDLNTHPVVTLKQVRIGEYMGAKTLSTQRSSTILLNPDIREAHELRGWYDTIGHGEVPTSVSSAQKTGSSSANDDRKLISQIKDENMGMSEKGDYFSCVANIAYIKSEGNVSYPACTSEGCNKKVVETGPSMWSCERCQKVLDHCEHRYVMSLQIADESGQTWVNAFNETGGAILGISANDLYRLNQEDPEGYKKVFEAAQFKSFLFRIKVKQETYNGESKIKNTIMTAVPLNYAEESARLADKIQQML